MNRVAFANAITNCMGNHANREAVKAAAAESRPRPVVVHVVLNPLQKSTPVDRKPFGGGHKEIVHHVGIHLEALRSKSLRNSNGHCEISIYQRSRRIKSYMYDQNPSDQRSVLSWGRRGHGVASSRNDVLPT